MTLNRRLILLLSLLLLPILLGSLLLHTQATRRAFVQELEARNAEAALALAQQLQQAARQAETAPAVDWLAVQFEQGRYQALSLSAPDGRLLLQRRAETNGAGVPAWFRRALPITASSGTAQLGDGSQLQLQAQSRWAHQALWTAWLHSLWLLAGLALLAALLAAVLLRGWQRPLAATVAQAEALEQGRFVTAPEPAWPELRQLTRSMNAMVTRLRQASDAQARQVAALERQAHHDEVSGLPRRLQFTGRLDALLAQAGTPPLCLLLVRVQQLELVNQRLGHDGTDRLLGALGDMLQTYVARVPGSFAGRLNGSDFALCLPAPGVALETGRSLLAALQASPLARAGSVEWAVGAVDGLQCGHAGAALAQADAALARAECEPGDGRLEVLDAATAGIDPAGARAWHARISDALSQGRVRLAECALLDSQRRLLHLECRLHLQLDPAGEYLPPGRWLALAARSRLLPELDLAGVRLALQAIAADGQPRGVHLAALSFKTPDFGARLQQMLRDAPEAARGLWLDLADAHPRRIAPLLREAAGAWRGLDVRLGVEHTGTGASELTAWQGAGLDYIKLDARHLRGLAADPALRDYALGLCSLIHGLGLLAFAEGVDEAADLQVLWTLGFDGATGPALAVPAMQEDGA